MPQSGFMPKTIVTDPQLLFGSTPRDSGFQRLCRHLSMGTSCQVLGERNAGKTSFLACCAAHLVKLSRSHLVVLPETRGLSNQMDLYRELLTAMHKSFAQRALAVDSGTEVRLGGLTLPAAATGAQWREVVSQFAPRDLPMIFGQYVNCLNELGSATVLLFDEYETLIEKCFDGQIGAFWPIHTMVEKAGEGTRPKPLTLVLAGSTDWGLYCQAHGSPPLNFIAEQVRVEPLSREDFAAMWAYCINGCSEGERKAVAAADMQMVYDMTGGWPFYGKVVGQHIVVDGEFREQHAAESLRPHFEVIWKQRSEEERQILFDVLAGRTTRNLSELVHRGLVETLGRDAPRLRGILWDRFVRDQAARHVSVASGLPGGSGDARPAAHSQYEFTLSSECYQIWFEAEHDILSPCKGLKILRTLIQNPNPSTATSVVVLGGGDEADEASARGVSAQEVATPETLKIVRQKLQEIEQQLLKDKDADAEDRFDPQQQRELEEQAAEMRKYLKKGQVCGRPKTFADAPINQAKDNVRKALKAAYKKMGAKLPNCVQHLKQSIRLERDSYAYRPSPPISWSI